MGRYRNLDNLYTPQGKPYKGTVRYPEPPLSFGDVYVYTDVGDR